MRRKVEIDEIEKRLCEILPGVSDRGTTGSGLKARNDVAILAALAKYACDLRKVLDEVSKEGSDWRENTRLLNRVINVLSWGNGL